ncbi:hypothetical protein [Bdellovibrio sp. NC01]|uniref:hypothetical protein n=1 Tax=Bdellovibrio sp. NC01 TaxID=2220073 RepID=UPI001159A51B|nr:hypothetical protein [Bdellovibrio sp. NC01]QDK37948.1 hypothetical protein DOE51_10295 [Bdellovibrio sp. NC01]
MKISEHFKLGRTQFELDFVDIHTDRDIPLFLDPNFIKKWPDRFCQEANESIRNFFTTISELIQADEIETARDLFRQLKEPKETFLGLSPTGQGTGVTKSNADEIFQGILESEAIQSGLVQDLEDIRIFVDDFDKDRLSDMTTNIIRRQLIDYTISQCQLWEIPLTDNVASGHYWDRKESNWAQSYDKALIIDHKKILLVPKRIVSLSERYTSHEYYHHYVLEFLREEQLKNGGPLVQRRKISNNPYVLKKDVAKTQSGTKMNLSIFSRKHPEIFNRFKSAFVSGGESSLQGNDIDDGEVEIHQLCNHLITELNSIHPGNDHATEYHKLVTGILSFLLYPSLFNPRTEVKIHDGRKRIDIAFENSAQAGVFNALAQHPKTLCPHVFAECKNYSRQVANPELDQLAGRFSPQRGLVGLLLCRSIDDNDRFIKTCEDTYRDNRGLIIPLTDEDLITSLHKYVQGSHKELEEIIRTKKNRIQLA